MPISTRTPEGNPYRCPVCGQLSAIEPSWPSGDAPCPSCGHLLWWFQQRLSTRLGVEDAEITLTTSLSGTDSLNIVELVMQLEEEFDVVISAGEVEGLATLQDLIAYIEHARRSKNPPENIPPREN